jgi:hypothetical protein
MPFLHTPGKRRSNRALTNFAIRGVTDYLNGGESIEWRQDNTSVYKDGHGDIFVELFDRPILRLKQVDSQPSVVYIYDGDHYDAYGNPTNLTRERLNGLLDALGAMEIIPENVRVTYDREESLCYVICLDSKAAINKNYCTKVGIKADPSEFVIADIEVVWNGQYKEE